MTDAEFEPIDDTTRQALAKISTATITTQLFKRGFRNLYILNVQLLNPDAPRMVGEAFTMRYIPAREDIDQMSVFQDPEHPQRKGIETIPPGQVLVMDCRGDVRAASGGGILLTRLKVRGVAGVVTDAGLRDAQEIAAMDFPVFCAGPSAPLNLAHHHAVDVNRPISCGGVPVYPGDVIVGDGDGVVVIPRHLAEDVARDGLEQERFERFVMLEIQGGKSTRGIYPPNDETLRRYEAWLESGGE